MGKEKPYNCEQCGEVFKRYYSPSREPDNKFCSQKCRGKYNRDGEYFDCSWCGDEIYKSPSQIGEMGDYSLDNHFCSKECESEFKSSEWVGENHPSWDGGNVELNCEECNAVFDVKPAQADEAKYCSQDCSAKAHTTELEEIECSWCKEKFNRKPHMIRYEHNLCSIDCQKDWLSEYRKGDKNPQWKGDDKRKQVYYGKNWPDQRLKAIKRDDNQCQECGLRRSEHIERFELDIHVHHKTPFRTFDDAEKANKLENLQTLCMRCHPSVE